MALLEMNYYSDALKMTTTVNVILPEKTKNSPGAGAPEGTYKTLYLYHGLSGDHTGCGKAALSAMQRSTALPW